MSTSTTTTQILFNSPALHSLKREQLLKLCKIHNIKATGKSGDLIERLKQHAATLPPDAPLNVAVRSEDETDSMSVDESPQRPAYRPSSMSRPSEAWEVVMDDIQELPETSSSQNTLNSLRTTSSNNASEFGTANSKCEPIVPFIQVPNSILDNSGRRLLAPSFRKLTRSQASTPVDKLGTSYHIPPYSRLPHCQRNSIQVHP